jgi:hypothetical protein
MCDQRRLLPMYNCAAARFNRQTRSPLAMWSPQIIVALGDAKEGKAGER